MNLIRRLFPFRTCTIDIKEGERALPRPCLLYHIKRCQGPCIEAISKDAYRADIDQVMLFLEGRQEQVARALRAEMAAASERSTTSGRPALRDKVRAIERTMESQKMAAFAHDRAGRAGLRPLGRRGRRPAVRRSATARPSARDVFLLENVATQPTTRRCRRSSSSTTRRPARSRRASSSHASPADAAELSSFLDARRGATRSPSTCRSAASGRALMELAARNAAETLAREQARWLADQGKTLAALEELAEALGLPAPPHAHRVLRHQHHPGHQHGRQHGRLRGGPAAQRRVPPLPGPDRRRAPDDFASHREVLRRRFRPRARGEEGTPRSCAGACPTWSSSTAARVRSSAARGVLDELGLHDLPLVGLAKEREELFLPGRTEPIVLPANAQALYLVQRLRDEAHRFAITYHRQLRAKAQTKSSSTTCRAWDRRASGRCCGSSARRSRCARRPSSRSRPCRASAAALAETDQDRAGGLSRTGVERRRAARAAFQGRG